MYIGSEMLKLIFNRTYWFKKIDNFILNYETHIHWPRETEVIQKLKFLHVIFSYTTIIIGRHEMNSTPAKVFLDQTGFHEEQNISLAVLLFKIVIIPQAIIYFNSIRYGIIIIRGPGTETNSSFIQSLQQRIKYNLNNIYKQA